MNIHYNKISHFLLSLSFLFFILAVQAQSTMETALRYIEQQSVNWQLTETDVADFGVSAHYPTTSLKVEHLYLVQRYQGIDIFNAMINLTIDQEGKVHHAGHRLLANLAQKINTTQPQIGPDVAVHKAAQYVGITIDAPLQLRQRKGAHQVLFAKGNFAEEDVQVKLCFFPTDEQTLTLAWDLAIRDIKSSQFPSIRIDASTGEVLDVSSWTHYATVDHQGYRNYDRQPRQKMSQAPVSMSPNHSNHTASQSGQYRVFPIPVESPSHGSRALVSNPHDPTASPYGWHDTNGSNGAEYTITRGNNVHAYHDEDGNNLSDNDEPDGGNGLNFDFPYNPNDEPSQYRAAAITNLFYTVNFLHDFAYRYGFDEVAGNFQQNNYGNGGFENDYVRVEAQDGSGINNAQFSTGPEGSKGRMEMFLWDRNAGGQRVVKVNQPEIAAGLYKAGLADFGPPISNTPITGEVVIIDDGINQALATDACEDDFVNADDLDGKIALIDRGGCDFELKTANAEANGAIAVIVCDFEEEPNFMNGVPGVPNPGIPTVRLGSVDCQKIRVHAGNGLEVSLVLPPPTGPDFIDGDFDNGAIAHEYAHGISERLTGGPNTVNCLNNLEQMGEGWSDFFALATTVQEGDEGSMRRGLATYLYREDTDGNGIRNYPYSTDMTTNPLTYRDIGNEKIPHGVGAVWGSMLWDLYWAFVEEYGWSDDLLNGNSGNNRMIQLVMDGMKMQPCAPGFVDARDAIILADELRYDGANQCLIWETFARRGLGWDAEQGDTDGVDAIESFDPYPLCVEALKIEKRSSPLIMAGSNFNVFIDVFNHRPQTLNNVVLTDELPEGVTFTGVSNWPATVDGNQIRFEFDNVAYLDTINVFYQVASDPDKFSIRKAFFDAETTDFWDPLPVISDNPSLFWQLSSTQKYTGDFSWFVPNTSAEARQQLVLKEALEISGERPALRFYHRYRTEPGVDGGVVEISTAANSEGAVFDQLGDAMIRNGYPGFVQYTTFIIPNLLAYTGSTSTFLDTYVDLSAYKGETAFLRFHFASSAGGSPPGGGYWFVDDIELMDLVAYNGEACISYDGGGNPACVEAADGGTIIQSQISTSTTDLAQDFSLTLFPNPADQQLTVQLTGEQAARLQISLVALDGRTLLERDWRHDGGTQQLALNVSQIAAGMYFVKVQRNDAVTVQKVIIE